MQFAEIELGVLAFTQESNAGVKASGQRMANDHDEALDELETIANDQDVKLSTAVSKHQQGKETLMGMSVFSFGTAYFNGQIRAHNEMMFCSKTKQIAVTTSG